MRSHGSKTAIAALCFSVLLALPGRAAGSGETGARAIVTQIIQPMMQRYGIPGMAVGVVTGEYREVLDFGVTSRSTGTPVTDETLFEIGSLSKTFTATLVAYAEATGHLSLSDPAGKYLPALRGGSLDAVSLLELGTHTPGGMPLQVPDEVTTDDQLMGYFRNWTPSYAPGTVRTYANPSIGLLGMIAARSFDQDFDVLMEREVFQPLGLRHTFLHVPVAEMTHYAQGYTKADAPIRMVPGLLASEAYGIRATGGDILRFIEANVGLVPTNGTLQHAITATHTGYYGLGAMTQDLIWEQYRYPVTLEDLLAGNSAEISTKPNPVVRIGPPSSPQNGVLINKTGSTNGFASYTAFIPGKKTGIVLLANKNYPIDARVTAAYQILIQLIAGAPGH